MAYLEMNVDSLKHNYDYLDKIFKENNINWSIVTKVLCGNKNFLTELLALGMTEVCDSRITNLKNIKAINDKIETIYIKPPSKKDIPNIVKYADISVNTEISTIIALAKAAKKINKTHKIIIMIEMGELREGVLRDDFIDFYEKVFELDNIKVVGIGTNFSCLYGVLPHPDKLIQLSLYEQLIEAKFNRQIPYVSGGSSVVFPLLLNGTLPKGINHFRLGETLYLGTNVFNDTQLSEMAHDIFTLHAEIIELMEKPSIPTGDFGTNLEGDSFSFDQSKANETSYRAIIGLGLLDVDDKHIWCNDKSLEFVGASSDMIVMDLNNNLKKYKVGDELTFSMDYMGLLKLMNSKYIDKKVVHN
jgi:predicted amino acid racemase